jgi:phosphonoacetaldehyde hydrolase
MLNYRYERRYKGPIQAVILDWAGTTMDFGCIAPAVVFVEIFEQAGVPITIEEARIPMGTDKYSHIRQILELDTVKQRWQNKFNKLPQASDLNMLFDNFVPIQLDCLSTYSDLIPGTFESVTEMKKRKIKIGATTGYLNNMTAIIAQDAKKQGYEPDSMVSANEVPHGRPYPDMCLQNIINLNVENTMSCIKVDDTVIGIHAGLNAGMWTIGLAMSGNEVGLSLNDFNALSEPEKTKKRTHAYEKMNASGAHYVIDSIADIMPCLDDIEKRLSCGEHP